MFLASMSAWEGFAMCQNLTGENKMPCNCPPILNFLVHHSATSNAEVWGNALVRTLSDGFKNSRHSHYSSFNDWHP